MKHFTAILIVGILVSAWPSTSNADLLGLRNKEMSMIRVNEIGSKFGPPSDQIDVEVVVGFAGVDGNYGFQLRNDGNRAVRRAMFDLLHDAFEHGSKVNIDYEVNPPKKNGVINRVWLTKP